MIAGGRRPVVFGVGIGGGLKDLIAKQSLTGRRFFEV